MHDDPAILTVLHDTETGRPASQLGRNIGTGLLFGAIGVYLAAIGLLLALQQRWVIVDVLGLGHATLAAIGLAAGAVSGHRSRADREASRLLQSLSAGALAGGTLALLVLVMAAVDLRSMFIALSRPLSAMLTFGEGAPMGALLLVVGGAGSAALGVRPDEPAAPAAQGSGVRCRRGSRGRRVPGTHPDHDASEPRSRCRPWMGLLLGGPHGDGGRRGLHRRHGHRGRDERHREPHRGEWRAGYAGFAKPRPVSGTGTRVCRPGDPAAHCGLLHRPRLAAGRALQPSWAWD